MSRSMAQGGHNLQLQQHSRVQIFTFICVSVYMFYTFVPWWQRWMTELHWHVLSLRLMRLIWLVMAHLLSYGVARPLLRNKDWQWTIDILVWCVECL